MGTSINNCDISKVKVNDPREWEDAHLISDLSVLTPYEQDVLRFVDGSKHKRINSEWGNRDNGLYYRTASIVAVRHFFFDYWQSHSPAVLEDIVERTARNVRANGPLGLETHFAGLVDKGVKNISFIELENPGYIKRGLYDSVVTPFRKVLRKHIDGLIKKEVLQKTPRYNHLHAVSVHPGWLYTKMSH